MSKKNRPNDDELKELLFSGYQDQSENLPGTTDPVMPTPMVLSIDQIEPYDKNPRRAHNAAWEEILHSLRVNGYRGRFPVTKRPGEQHYIPAEGGNTTLKAMKKLAAEGDERFRDIPVEFIPWDSESRTLVAHLVENDARSDLIFIDKARALQDAREQLEQELGTQFSRRELARQLEQRGYKIDQSSIARLEYALALEPALPEAFAAGAGEPFVRKLRNLETVFQKIIAFHQGEEPDRDQLRSLFIEALMPHDAPEPDMAALHEGLVGYLAAWLGAEQDAIRLEFESLLNDPSADLEALHATAPEPEQAQTGSDGTEGVPGPGPVQPEPLDEKPEPATPAAPAAPLPGTDDSHRDEGDIEPWEATGRETEGAPSATRPVTAADLARPGDLPEPPAKLVEDIQKNRHLPESKELINILLDALRKRTRHLAELGVSPYRNPHTLDWDEFHIVELVRDSKAGMGAWIDLPPFNMGNDRYAPGGGWGHQCWIWWHIASGLMQFHVLHHFTAEYVLDRVAAHEAGEEKPRLPRLVEDYATATEYRLNSGDIPKPLEREQLEWILQRANNGFVMQRPFLYQSLDMSVPLTCGDPELAARVRHFDEILNPVWQVHLRPIVLAHPDDHTEDLLLMAQGSNRMRG